MHQTENVLEDFYNTLANGGSLNRVHIPHSTVFYVRTHLESVFGRKFELDYVERCLYLEGYLKAHDVFEPERIREGVG